MFALLSDILLRAHTLIAPGLEMESCMLQRTVKHPSIGFLENVDGQITAGPPVNELDLEEEDTASEIVADLNRAGVIWNSLLEMVGQSIALSKVKWRALIWEMQGKESVLSVNAPGRIQLKDSWVTSVNIIYVPPNKPNEGLGFLMFPDGNQHCHSTRS